MSDTELEELKTKVTDLIDEEDLLKPSSPEPVPSTSQPVKWVKRDSDGNIIFDRPRSSRRPPSQRACQSRHRRQAHSRATESQAETYQLIRTDSLANGATSSTRVAAISSPRPPGHYWSEDMTRFMLTQVKELNVLKFMDGSQKRNADLFKTICAKMREAGFFRTPEQVRLKWKNTRKAYIVALQKSSKGAQEWTSFPYFDQMEDLFGRRTLFRVAQQENGVDIGFEQLDKVTMEMGATTGEESAMETGALDETTQQPEEDYPRSTSPLTERRGRQRPPDMTLICEEMARNRAFWKQQMKESDDRQERVLMRIIQDSNAATNAMMEALLEGLKSLRQTAPLSHATPQHAGPAPQPGARAGPNPALPGPSSPVGGHHTSGDQEVLAGANPGKTPPAGESESLWSGVKIQVGDRPSSQLEDSGQAIVKDEELVCVKTEEEEDQQLPVSSAPSPLSKAKTLSETPRPRCRRLEIRLKDVREEETGCLLRGLDN